MLTLRLGRHLIQYQKRFFNSNEMAYSEKRLIGFSRDEMFNVVSDVSNYHNFVPWCRTSKVTHEHESSQSVVIENDNLFRTLDTTFRFGKGNPSVNRSCTLHYDLVFEFESAFHSRIAHLFFDKVVKTMVSAFLLQAEKLYGPPDFPHSPPKVLQYKS